MTGRLVALCAPILLLGSLAWGQPHDEGHEGEDPAPAEEHEAEAEGHEAEHGEGHGHEPLNFVSCHAATIPIAAMFLNFAILVFIVIRLARKPIAAFLQARHAAIKEALEEARRVHSEASDRYREYSLRLETLDEELGRLRAEMKAAGTAEHERIIAEARERAERLQRETDFLLGQELKQLRKDLEREVAEAAVNAAEQTLRKVTDKADQERMAEDYLKALRSADKEGAS